MFLAWKIENINIWNSSLHLCSNITLSGGLPWTTALTHHYPHIHSTSPYPVYVSSWHLSPPNSIHVSILLCFLLISLHGNINSLEQELWTNKHSQALYFACSCLCLDLARLLHLADSYATLSRHFFCKAFPNPPGWMNPFLFFTLLVLWP